MFGKIEELKDQVRNLESEVLGLEKEVDRLESEVTNLGNKVEELESQLPDTKTLDDLVKFELFKEHYQKFTLQQFEDFLLTI